MSNLKIEELFTVDASVETVWKFLLDPAEVATCLPGAKLDGLVEGESDTYRGTMKVKVGPVVSEFRGKATMSDVDAQAHRLKLGGTGDDAIRPRSQRKRVGRSTTRVGAQSRRQISGRIEVDLAFVTQNRIRARSGRD